MYVYVGMLVQPQVRFDGARHGLKIQKDPRVTLGKLKMRMKSLVVLEPSIIVARV